MTADADLIHFEDLEPGTTFSLGPMPVDKAEVIAFASQYDAQPMHLDEDAARHSLLGGLAASGWHTCAMLMRMMADAYIRRMAGEGAPGVDFVKWRRPVLAGDVLSGSSRVLTRRRLRSRPEIGIVNMRHQLVNQRGEVVLESENPVMVRIRAPDGDLA